MRTISDISIKLQIFYTILVQ